MSSNYLQFFNLRDDPFRLTPDTDYFYNSPEHSTALLSLEYCFREKEGFCVITGEPGTGKTTVIRLFVEKWKEMAEIALIMTPRLSPEEFFLAVLEDFNVPLTSSSKNDLLKAFRDFLLANAAKERRVGIIVDEAQQLPDLTLEELRLLSNLETGKEKLLQIILAGQPELERKLESRPLRQLNQRITVRAELKPLTKEETSDYITSRLLRAGGVSQIFTQKGREAIFDLSGGKPRRINLLSTRAMMSAFLDGAREVSPEHVKKGGAELAMKESAADSGASKRVKKPGISSHGRLEKSPLACGWRALLILASLIAVGGLCYYLGYMRHPDSLIDSVQTPVTGTTLQAAPPPAAASFGNSSSARGGAVQRVFSGSSGNVMPALRK